MTNLKSKEITIFAIAPIFMIIWAICFWRCKYGFASDDEAFYLAIPYHLCQGDSLFVNEWNLAQSFSFLLYPLVKLYLGIIGSTEGIVLSFRYIFTVTWGIIAIFIFQRLKCYSLWGAAIAAYSFLLFSRCGVPALSYNTLGIACLLVALLIICTNDSKFHFNFFNFIAGIFFAASVLCDPYLVFLFVIFSIIAFLAVIIKRTCLLKLAKSWLFITIGIAFLAIIFIIFLLLRTTPAKIIEAIPCMFSNSLNHGNSTTISSKLTSIYWAFMYCGGTYTFYSIIVVAATTLIALIFPKFKKIGFTIVLVCYAVSLYGILINWAIPDALMFPIVLLGGYCGFAFFKENTNIQRLFLYLWLPGIIYAFLFFFSSDTMFSGFSAGCTVPAVASYLIIALVLENLIGNDPSKFFSKLLVRSVAFLLCFQIFVQLRNKCEFQLSGSFETIKEHFGLLLAVNGPQAGLYSSSVSVETYDTLLADTETMRNKFNPEQVCYITISPVTYLTGPERMGSFSAWLTGIHNYPSHTIESLSKYYSLNPERIPDVVFIHKNNNLQMPNETCKLIEAWFIDSFRAEKHQLPSGNIILYFPST